MPFRQGLVEVGRRKRCQFSDGLTSLSVTVCWIFGTVEKVFGLRRRSRVAVSRLDGCRCVR
jgi:hypothetical protein